MTWKLTTAIGTLALVPTLVLAQQTTADTSLYDTTITSTEEGRLAEPSESLNLGLTSDQVKELQQAINDNGCHAGEVTGTINDETKQGIECIRQAKNIQSSDINDVLKALDLDFEAKSGAGVSDTTDSSWKSSDTTFTTDSGAIQSDTTTTYDTTTPFDTTQTYDTTAVPDTSPVSDTSMFQHDTSMMQMDSMPSLPDTSRNSPMRR